MTNSAENKVTVNIYGEEYPITGVSDPAYISRIADYVDLRMKETAKNSRVAARDKVAILAAMSIASEFYENNDSKNEFQKQFSSKIDNLISRLDSVL